MFRMPTFNDAQMYALFMAAMERLARLNDEGFSCELETLQQEGTEADVQEYITECNDLLVSYTCMRGYFSQHEKYGWHEDDPNAPPYYTQSFKIDG